MNAEDLPSKPRKPEIKPRSLFGMTTSLNPYRGFRFPAEIIEHTVWLYHCFSLSLLDVETILAARGIMVSYG